MAIEEQEIDALDRLDRAEHRLREVLREPTVNWLRLLEAIHDDAFEVGLENLLGPDLPFNAYWQDEENVDQALAPGSIPWWPNNLYYILFKNPNWKPSAFAHKRKQYKRAYSTSPMEKKVPIRETNTPSRNDDEEVLELLQIGVL